MIRPQAIVDFRRLDKLAEFARNHPKVVARAAADAFKETSPDLLHSLRREGLRRALHPFVWSNDPQKNRAAARYYFWAVNSGLIKTDAYGYVRTGELTDAYDLSVITTRNGEVTAFVRNKANRAYRYTIGKRQVPGHAATGWSKDEPIIAEWVTGYRTTVIDRLDTQTRVDLA